MKNQLFNIYCTCNLHCRNLFYGLKKWIPAMFMAGIFFSSIQVQAGSVGVCDGVCTMVSNNDPVSDILDCGYTACQIYNCDNSRLVELINHNIALFPNLETCVSACDFYQALIANGETPYTAANILITYTSFSACDIYGCSAMDINAMAGILNYDITLISSLESCATVCELYDGFESISTPYHAAYNLLDYTSSDPCDIYNCSSSNPTTLSGIIDYDNSLAESMESCATACALFDAFYFVYSDDGFDAAYNLIDNSSSPDVCEIYNCSSSDIEVLEGIIFYNPGYSCDLFNCDSSLVQDIISYDPLAVDDLDDCAGACDIYDAFISNNSDPFTAVFELYNNGSSIDPCDIFTCSNFNPSALQGIIGYDPSFLADLENCFTVCGLFDSLYTTTDIVLFVPDMLNYTSFTPCEIYDCAINLGSGEAQDAVNSILNAGFNEDYLNDSCGVPCQLTNNCCPPGTFVDGGGCTQCPPGFYQPDSNQIACIPCPVGTYNEDFGATGCTVCSSDFSGQTGQVNCPCDTSILTITGTVAHDPICHDAGNGFIVITSVSGGTPSYQYSIDNGINFQSAFDFNDLGGGAYNIIVQDTNGCQTDTTIVLNNPTEVTVSVVVTDDTCGDGSGSIMLTGAGGTGSNYNYSIDDGFNFQSSGTFTGLSAGTYEIEMTDGNGCAAAGTQVTIINDTIPPTAVCQDITVQLDSNGTASITPQDVDGGSSDNCGIDSMWLSQSDFDCNDVATFVTAEHMPAGDDGGYGTINGQWQSFLATESGNLGIVEVSLDILPFQNAFMKIYEGVGTGGALLDSNVIHRTMPAVAFFKNIEIDSGQVYSIYIEGSTNGWNIVGGDPYIDGMNSVNDGDFKFRVLLRDWLNTTLYVSSNGQLDSCTSNITLCDTIKPNAVCRDLQITLSESKPFALFDSIDNSSSDNCGVIYTGLWPFGANCENTGVINSTLTVVDAFGNTSSCIANVEVSLDSCNDNDCATTDSWDLEECECVFEPNPNGCDLCTNDTIPPVAECFFGETFNAYLDTTGSVTVDPWTFAELSYDNCGIDSVWLSQYVFTCADIPGDPVVTLFVRDSAGNVSQCSEVVNVRDTVRPVITCKDTTLYLDASGAVEVSTFDLITSSTYNCFPDTTEEFFIAGCLDLGTQQFQVNVFASGGKTGSCISNITVLDTLSPVLSCPEDIITCDSLVNYEIGFTDGCFSDTLIFADFENSSPFFATTFSNVDSLCPIEGNGVRLYPRNLSSRASTNDYYFIGSPGNISYDLKPGDEFGQAATCEAPDADNYFLLQYQEYDSLGKLITLDSFTIAAVPSQTHISYPTPLELIGKKVKFVLIAQGGGTDGDVWTFDNFLITQEAPIQQIAGLPSGSVFPAGATVNTFVATDFSGNTDTCSFTVTVSCDPCDNDTIPPTAVCRNFTVYLDANGEATLWPDSADNGSFDNCGGPLTFTIGLEDSLALSCNDVGSFSFVPLEVTDASGNLSSCVFGFELVDEIKPTAVCKDITVYLDENGQGSFFTRDLDNGSTDNCGVFVEDDTLYVDCNYAGVIDYQLIVSQVSLDVANEGDLSVCEAQVTIVDSTAPTLVCPADITVSSDPDTCGAVVNFEVGLTEDCYSGDTLCYHQFEGNDIFDGGCFNSRNNETHVSDSCGSFSGKAAVLDGELNVTRSIEEFSLSLPYGGTVSFYVQGGGCDPIEPGDSLKLYYDLNNGGYTLLASFDTGYTSLTYVSFPLPPTGTGVGLKFEQTNHDGLGTDQWIIDEFLIVRNKPIVQIAGLASGSFFPQGTTTNTFVTTDLSGNSDTCSFDVTVNCGSDPCDNDIIPPTAICQDITVSLNNQGKADITPEMVNNGSSDNCGIAGWSVSPSLFICTDRGPNTVSLVVFDTTGNADTCTANVTIADSLNICNATVVVLKEVIGDNPDADQQFRINFNTSIPDFLGNFYVSESGIGSPQPEGGIFEELPPATFHLTEKNIPVDWSLNEIQCTSTTGQTNFNYEFQNDKVIFSLRAGDSVTCTFINLYCSTPIVAQKDTTICSSDSIFLQGAWQTQPGTYYDTLAAVNGCDSICVTTLDAEECGAIELTKVVDWSGVRVSGSQTFEICIDGNGLPAPICLIYPDTGGTEVINLAGGTYTISEINPGDQWTVDIVGSPVTVIPGDTAFVTVTNTHDPAGGIYFKKVVFQGDGNPAIPDQTFRIQYSNGVRNIGSTALPQNGNWFGRNDLQPGEWKLEERSNFIPANWTLDSIVCVSRDSTSTIGTFIPGTDHVFIDLASYDRVDCEVYNSFCTNDTTNEASTTCEPGEVGVTQQVFTNLQGCDSVVFTTTTLLPSDTTNIGVTTCVPGEVGVDQQLFANQYGCDSVVVITTILAPNDSCCDINNPAVVGFTLMYENYLGEIRPLVDNDVISRDTLCRFSVRADICPDTVGSVRFQLSGAQNHTRIENVVPYSLFGDAPPAKYYVWVPNTGNYTLTATPYSAAGAGGTAGTPLTVSFTVTGSVANTASVCSSAPQLDCNQDVGGTAYTNECGFCVEGNTGLPADYGKDCEGNCGGSAVCCSTNGDCDDNDPCTIDSCNGAQCINTPIICDDGNACTSDECVGGTCVFTSISCDDNNPCTVDECDSLLGCINTPIVCDDNNACTTDACAGGSCVFTPIVCDDGNPCTTDACNSIAGCVYTPIPNCGDCELSIASFTLVNATTNADIAALTNGYVINKAVTPSFSIRANECEQPVGSVKLQWTGPNNGTKVENIAPYAIAGDNPQGNYTPWNAGVGFYSLTATPYTNGGAGGTAGTPLTVNFQIINQALPDCASHTDCDDGNPCTVDVCNGGTCVNMPVDIDDGNACTVDACNPITGAITHTTINCNDNNPCTIDYCDNVLGCVHDPIDGCCTTNADCDDGDPCTEDICDGDTCIYVPISGSGASYIQAVNPAKSWRKLKLGYHPNSLWAQPAQNVIAGGNTHICITLRLVSGTIDWNKIEVRPQGLDPVSFGPYVPVGGIGSAWETICIPLSAFPTFDFTQLYRLQVPYSNGANPFEIHVQRIEFTGGITPFLWFGDPKTDNAHDGQSGMAGALIAEVVEGNPCDQSKINPSAKRSHDSKEDLLLRAYPNPFKDKVLIEFRLAEEQRVKLEVMSLEGRSIKTIHDGLIDDGKLYQFEFEAGSLSSGMYFYRLITEGGEVYNRKLMLVR